jgi:hypothetical protein
VYAYSCLTLALNVTGSQLDCPAALFSEKGPATHNRGGGVGFRARLEGYGEEKNSLNPGTSSPYSVNINYTNSWAGGEKHWFMVLVSHRME